MDMQSLIEKSHIGHWMKRSGKTFDDIDKFEKYEYEQLEKEITTLEKEKEELEESLLSPTISVEYIIENSKRLSEVTNQIDEKSFRWMELDELM